jgi:hypothetical protein
MLVAVELISTGGVCGDFSKKAFFQKQSGEVIENKGSASKTKLKQTINKPKTNLPKLLKTSKG